MIFPQSHERERFDIRNYLDSLTPVKGKHRYECPVCGGHALTVNPKTGAYKCWSNECDSKDIREAIAPQTNIFGNTFSPSPQRRKLKPKPKPPTPAPIPTGEIELAILPYSPTPPQPVKRGNCKEIKYPYSDSQWVLRKQFPDKKLTLPYHTSNKGEIVCGKGDNQWQPYRWDEVLKYGPGKWLLGAEGEKDVDNSRSNLQLVTFTFQGGSWGEDSLLASAKQLKDAGVAGIIYYPDNDDAGAKKAEKLALACAKAKLPFVAINPLRLWEECPNKGDISDWIDSGLASVEALNKEIVASVSELPKPKNREVTREQWKAAKCFNDLLELVPKFKDKFTRRKQPWGFGEKQKQQPEQEPKTTPIHIYEKGDRNSSWINSESKYIFDSSGTGSGKSYDAGRLQPSDFDCEKIFYISNDSRNPTTPTLQKDWAHLEGRHKGLNRDDKDKLRRKKDGGKGAAIPPNCARVDTIAALSTANIQSAYSANVACNNCAYLEACKGGHLFGYLNDRAKAFGNSRIISHPQSLPSPNEDFDYSDSVLIWEEWSEVLKNFDEVRITVRDVDMMIATLATDNLELFQQLHSLLTKIKSLLTKGEKAPTRYGWSNENLHQLLKVPDIDLVKLAEATIPNLDALNPTNEHGVDIADLPAGVRKRFQQFDNETANKVSQTVLKQWILPLLEILKGDCIGYLSCDFNNLIITTPNSRLAEIAVSAKKNIFLDATGRVIDLAQLLVIPHTQIFSCKQKADDSPTNLEVIQVTGLGRMGISRGEDQQRRGEAVIAEITKQCEEKGENCEVISFKKFDGKYQWFVDSRGSNDLEGVQNIILDGIPTPNLESLAAEFTCIYNRTPEAGTKVVKEQVEVTNQLPEGIQPYFEYEVSVDDEFADFIRQRILEAIKQAIGRNRSDRFPDKQFKVYVLGDYPLNTLVKLVQAQEITPDAATKIDRLKLAIEKAVQHLKEKGQKITQKAIAKLCNVSQQRISQLREFLLVLLKGTIYTKTSKNNSPPNAPPDGDWVAQEFIPLVVAEGENSIVNEVISLLNVYSPSELLQIWELVAPKVQIDLLSVLLGTIPEALIRYEGG